MQRFEDLEELFMVPTGDEPWYLLGEVAEALGMSCSELLTEHGALEKSGGDGIFVCAVNAQQIDHRNLDELIEATRQYEQEGNLDAAGGLFVLASWAKAARDAQAA